jgi:hypothetical protein
MADPTEPPEDDEGQAPKKNWRKELEDRAEAAERAQVEMATELAILKSGLADLTDAQRADVLTLAKANGDTGADALKAIAERLSYTKPPEAPEPEQPAQDDQAAMDLAQLATFAQASGRPSSGQAAPTYELDEYTDNKSLKDFLMSVVPDDFGPSKE